MKKRNEIDDKYKISLKDLFKNEEEFKKELDEVVKNIPNIAKYQGHVLDNANNLYEVLALDMDISKRLERLAIYAHLLNDFDLSDNKGNTFYGQVTKTYNEYAIISSYIIPEILSKDYSLIEKYLLENKKLSEYQRVLEEIFRQKKHILSKEEENILSQVNDAYRLPDDAYSKLINVDLKFKKIKNEKGVLVDLNNSSYGEYISSANRKVRKDAFKSLYKGYEGLNNTLSTLLAYQVKNENNMAKLRKYNSSLEEALNSDNIDVAVYDTLLKAIDKNMPIIHQQWQLYKDILNIKDLHIYDVYAPLVKDYDKKYSFEEAKDLVLKALEILGDDYQKHLKEAFDNNWIDVYPSQNKRGGGYCTSAYLAHPYVFLNFDGRYDEVSTLAHELGHAMHYYYAQTNQKYQDYSYTIFVAEVASQVNEILLSYYMIDNAQTKEEKYYILDELIKRFKASTVRQSMFAEFEKIIHDDEAKGEILTKEYFNDLYYKLNVKYYGKDVIIDDEIKYEWSRIPHFYYNFYVYQYATGYISALKIANDIYHHQEGALENYLAFLKLGCTKDPVTSLKIAGVDLTKEETYDKAFKEFAKELEMFSKLKEGEENGQ